MKLQSREQLWKWEWEWRKGTGKVQEDRTTPVGQTWLSWKCFCATVPQQSGVTLLDYLQVRGNIYFLISDCIIFARWMQIFVCINTFEWRQLMVTFSRINYFHVHNAWVPIQLQGGGRERAPHQAVRSSFIHEEQKGLEIAYGLHTPSLRKVVFLNVRVWLSLQKLLRLPYMASILQSRAFSANGS